VVPDKASEALQFDFLDQPGKAPPIAPIRPDSPVAGQRQTVGMVPRSGVLGDSRPPEPGASSDSAFSVTELYDRVQVALRVGFPDEIWVTGEIRKVTVGRTGHRFIELTDAGSGDGVQAGAAMLDVACWNREWPTIAAELDEAGVQLDAGLIVRVLGRLGTWHGASKLRLSMTALDVEALVGGIAAARRRLLRELTAEGLLEANRRLPRPVVPLRIGIVTSAGSEAYHDFAGTLERSGFAFVPRLEHAQVQGSAAPGQIATAIRRLHGFEPDVIVLVRGGGGRSDLAAFDSGEVARAIAASRFPVWTGIGHSGDRSVADEVAQRALVTPTACAEALCELVETYVGAIEAKADRLGRLARQRTEAAGTALERDKRRLSTAAGYQVDRASGALERSARRTVHAAVRATDRSSSSLSTRAEKVCDLSRRLILGAGERLAADRRMLAAFDPKRQLARGWSLTRRPDGRVVRSIAELQSGDALRTVLADGVVSSVVSGLEPDTSAEPGSTGRQVTEEESA
jgi:exodeoxyribonuclease VII large subunit